MFWDFKSVQSGVANTRRNQALLIRSGERRSARDLSRLTPNALFIMLKGLAKPHPEPPQIDARAGLTEATGAKYASRLTFETLWAPEEVAPRTDHDAPQTTR